MSDIFRKDKSQTLSTEEELKEAIRVVPSSFKFIAFALVIVVAAVVLWLAVGWHGTTMSVTGIYHPGASSKGEVLCFPNVTTGKQLEEGMTVNVYFDGYDQNSYGYLMGVITYVDPYVTSEETMTDYLEEASLVSVFAKNAPCVAVICRLDTDPESANGYACSSKKGEDIKVRDGCFVTVSTIITE